MSPEVAAVGDCGASEMRCAGPHVGEYGGCPSVADSIALRFTSTTTAATTTNSTCPHGCPSDHAGSFIGREQDRNQQAASGCVEHRGENDTDRDNPTKNGPVAAHVSQVWAWSL